jgi:hypothetical protein
MLVRDLLGCVALGFALFAAGCGSDDGDTMTRQEWVAAADAICVEMNTQLEGISEPQTIDEIAAAQSQVEDVWRAGLADLKGLALPSDDEEAAAQVIDAFDVLVSASVEWGDAFVAAGEMEEMSPEVEALFRELDAASADAVRLAGSYGLEHCFTNQDQ